MINFKEISKSQAFSAWVDFVDSDKGYVCKLPKNSQAYRKTVVRRTKMPALEVLNVMEQLLKDASPLDTFERAHLLLDRFKKNCEKSHYSGLVGRLRKIASYIFTSFQFENSSNYRKIVTLSSEMEQKRKANVQFERSVNNPVTLHDLKSCYEEFFNRKKQDMILKQSDGGLEFWTNKEKEVKGTIQNLKLNPYDEFTWYWQAMEGLYTDNNRETLIDMEILFPEAFQKRHNALIKDLK